MRSLPIIPFALEGHKSPFLKSKNARGGHLVFQNEVKNIPRQDFMVMNISCKFEKASYNIFFVRAVTVESLYTLRRRRRNEVKFLVSTGCYPVDTIINFYKLIPYPMDHQGPPIQPRYLPTRALHKIRQQKRCYDVTLSGQEGSTR